MGTVQSAPSLVLLESAIDLSLEVLPSFEDVVELPLVVEGVLTLVNVYEVPLILLASLLLLLLSLRSSLPDGSLIQFTSIEVISSKLGVSPLLQ